MHLLINSFFPGNSQNPEKRIIFSRFSEQWKTANLETLQFILIIFSTILNSVKPNVNCVRTHAEYNKYNIHSNSHFRCLSQDSMHEGKINTVTLSRGKFRSLRGEFLPVTNSFLIFFMEERKNKSKWMEQYSLYW